MDNLNLETQQKIKQALIMFNEGKTKTEIGRTLGFKDFRGFYSFMRRNGMVWNKDKNTYETIDGRPLEVENFEEVEVTPTGKIALIISMLSKGMEGIDIARKLKFDSFQQMADYLKSKGYVWNEEKQNYIREKKHVQTDDIETDDIETVITLDKIVDEIPGNQKFEKFYDILKLLEDKKAKLVEILMDDEEKISTIPKFTLSGITTVKSINLLNSIGCLVKEFSFEKNISQKEIFQTALINFLKKYGYKEEVKKALGV